MAYDQTLADRVRKVLSRQPDVTGKEMFGGICFLLSGRMCCGVVGKDLMVRVAKERYEMLLSERHARPMDFTGRPMTGMIYVAPKGIREDGDLRRWVAEAIRLVRSLEDVDAAKKAPKKAPKRAAGKASGRAGARS